MSHKPMATCVIGTAPTSSLGCGSATTSISTAFDSIRSTGNECQNIWPTGSQARCCFHCIAEGGY